jgi:hypothetical protein
MVLICSRRGGGWQLMRALGYTPIEIEELVVDFKRELGDENNRLFWNL